MSEGCLLEYLKNKFRQMSRSKINPYVFLDLDQIDLNQLILQVCCDNVFYYKSKNKKFALLSVGKVKSFLTKEEVYNFLEEYPEAFLSCPMSFEEITIETNTIGNIFLGEWTFISNEKGTKAILFQDPITQNFSAPEVFFEPISVSNHDLPMENWQSDEVLPDYTSWCEMMVSAKKLFSSSDLKKIVLSRKRIFEFFNPPQPKSLFYHLINANPDTGENFLIYFQENLNSAFISLSPETLFSFEGNTVSTIALAASAPRASDFQEDVIEEKSLYTNSKLINEHQLVVDEIKNSLEKVCQDIKVSELKIMKLSYIQHRSLDITATTHKNIHAIDLLKQLHPTAAIGGLPKNLALKNIKAIEGSPRNHYSAPFGVINRHFSEFAVGIRSGKIENNKLTLYAGAGILPESSPEAEWIETSRKMTPFLRVLNHA